MSKFWPWIWKELDLMLARLTEDWWIVEKTLNCLLLVSDSLFVKWRHENLLLEWVQSLLKWWIQRWAQMRSPVDVRASKKPFACFLLLFISLPCFGSFTIKHDLWVSFKRIFKFWCFTPNLPQYILAGIAQILSSMLYFYCGIVLCFEKKKTKVKISWVNGERGDGEWEHKGSRKTELGEGWRWEMMKEISR